jgi:ABC-type molybdate transport system substrate-binding protein
MRRICLLLVLSSVCLYPAGVLGQRTTYGVTVDVIDAAALIKAATYTFVPGQPAFDKTIDQLIISAIDRQLKARGVTKVASGSADMVVTYLSVRRTDVDLKSKPSAKDGTLREYPVGTLIVSISDPVDRQKKLFNGRIDEPINLDPATFEATSNAAVGAIFEKYPRKAKTP